MGKDGQDTARVSWGLHSPPVPLMASLPEGGKGRKGRGVGALSHIRAVLDGGWRVHGGMGGFATLEVLKAQSPICPND